MGGSTCAYLGFTAGTGGSHNLQQVHLDSLTATLMPEGDDTALASSLAGNDTIAAGPRKANLTGGLGADSFDFNFKTDSPRGAHHDVITDFSGIGLDGDQIDVHDIDANTQLRGNQDFHFIGARHFHQRAGELHFVKHGGFVTVEGDVNGDGRADFQIAVHNLTDTLNSLAKGNFDL
jgi:Ca2+-binding RTX toxin-like protein